jgi:CYTH domain-containing protein
MGLEIERKFLVNTEKWNAITKSPGLRYRQGYLFMDDQKVVRVRETPDGGYITS